MIDVLAPNMIEKSLIISVGEDPHMYNFKPEDLDKLKEADLVLFHSIHFNGKMVEVLEDFGKAVTRNFTDEDIQTFE